MTQGVKDPALSTRDMASWLGVTTEYIRGELRDGRLPFDNVSRSPRRAEYRVRFSDFVRYVRRRGAKRLPALDDFRAAN